MNGLLDPSDGDASEAGFTFIEALVVLTIAALAIALVPGAIGLGKRALETAAALERSVSDRRAMSAVTTRIAAARPTFQTGADGLATLVFEGRPDRLRFVTEFSDGPHGGGLYAAELAMAPDQSALVLSLTPYPLRQGETVPARRTVLMPAESLTLRYFGFDRETNDRRWQTSWATTDRLPELVELSAKPPGLEHTLMPEVVAVRLAAPTAAR
jgi:type II secretory pathway pseudopilin PulG